MREREGRGGEGRKERKKHWCQRDINWLPPITHSPGVCPDCESNLDPSVYRTTMPASTGQGLNTFNYFIVNLNSEPFLLPVLSRTSLNGSWSIRLPIVPPKANQFAVRFCTISISWEASCWGCFFVFFFYPSNAWRQCDRLMAQIHVGRKPSFKLSIVVKTTSSEWFLALPQM